MKRQIVVSSTAELSRLQQRILAQMQEIGEITRNPDSKDDPLGTFKRLRFERIVADPLFDEIMNFTEYLNQVFTYLVCLYAGKEILHRFSPNIVVINFGVQSGHDVASFGGDIICECFAATSVKSNEKLKKDVLRVHQNETAKKKLVYFYSDSAAAEQGYIQRLIRQYPDVSINCISFDQLISK